MSATRKIVIGCLFILSTVTLNKSYRILGIFPYNGKSHNVMFDALMNGLAIKGHQVDLITHFSSKHPPPTYTTIIKLSGTLDDVPDNMTFDFTKQVSSDGTGFVADLLGNSICHLMNLEPIQKLIKNPPNDPPYDLLITEVCNIENIYHVHHMCA